MSYQWAGSLPEMKMVLLDHESTSGMLEDYW